MKKKAKRISPKRTETPHMVSLLWVSRQMIRHKYIERRCFEKRVGGADDLVIP